MGIKKIIKLFEDGNVSISGLRGTGKDMLMGNVIIRRGLPYVSNLNYGGKWIPLNWPDIDCHNNYTNFISGKINHFDWPYPDRVDIYASDLGIILPSQFCNELNRNYGYLPVTQALTRHFGLCNFHYNTQNLNRVYDKVREQSDLYIRCISCHVIFGIVFQRIIIYENYESCVKRVPPFRLRKPLLNADRRQQWEIQKTNYEITWGTVTPMFLIYRNRSTYNTRYYKELMANA